VPDPATGVARVAALLTVPALAAGVVAGRAGPVGGGAP
jgi:hypothetical protein